MSPRETHRRRRTWNGTRVFTPLFIAILTIAFLCDGVALANSTHPLFDLSTPSTGPFPSDRFTVADVSQNTGERIALPKPDCLARPSDCADFDLLNELDGFNLSPRLSIPFDGPIDLSTATNANIFLVGLGSTLPGGAPGGHVSGIDQVVWDPAGTTLYVESDEFLEQHTRYALIVTKDVHDPSGKEVKAAKSFVDFVDETITTSTGDPALDAYRAALRGTLTQLDASGIVSRGQVVAASVFTTLSVSANLEKIRDQVKAGTPSAASFLLGPGGARTVFPRSALTGLVFNRQMSANPAAPLSPMTINLAALDVVPGVVGSVAFGKYVAPEYRIHPGEYIPQVGTLSGTPSVQGTSEVTFLLFLPSSPKPPLGYPVVIYGHGGNTNKSSSAFVVAKMAEHGIATIAIDAPGGGFGPQSTYKLTFTDATTMTFRSGSRGLDQNGDGRIAEGEGFNPAPPRAILIGGRGDGYRQWTADHMQLVRVIEAGMDVDGDGSPDLDPSRIYYVGTSNGGRQGAMLLALDPDVRAGALNDASTGAAEERLTANRAVLAVALQNRVPSLVNAPGVVGVDGVSVFPLAPPYCNENLPLRQSAPYSVVLENGASAVIRSPLVDSVPGALEIQEVLERAEWGVQAASSAAYGSYLRRHPLAGVPAKPVIVQLAFGDRVIPNPATTAMLRAADLADRATFFRSDLAFPAGNPVPSPAAPILYPHIFLQLFTDPALTARALQAQEQIASFFALDGPDHVLDPFDGSQITDPDPDGPIFEVPIVPPLPAGLDYPGSAAPAAMSGGAARGAGSEPDGADANTLDAPQPNPSSPAMTFTIHLRAAAPVELAVYDTRGRLIRTLAGHETFPAGTTRVRWDGRGQNGDAAASGVYFVRVEAGELRATRRVVVIR